MKCKVYPYPYNYKLKTFPLVNSVTAYEHLDGDTFILILNQYLVMIDEGISLICQIQIKANGFIVEYFPHNFEIEERIIRYSIV